MLVVSGLPGAGKSTLIRRVVPALDGRGEPVRGVDSQDSRARLERRLRGLPVRLPYGVYRPAARLAHYARLWRALRSGASLVVHDCGQRGWVRRLLAREARRRGTALHVLLLAVEPGTALAGQRARGRTVSRAAFGRHRRAMERLVAAAVAGRPPAGATSVLLLDRPAATALRTITFAETPGGPDGAGAPAAPAVPKTSSGPPAPSAPAVPAAPGSPAVPPAPGAPGRPAPGTPPVPGAPPVPLARRPARPVAVPLPPPDGEPAVKVRVRARRDRGENG
ncbi:AAA family ATPase [Streptomyces mobaraensis NBRC 13819 = DSM 40847]|nr:AAA family ATPase [Streptomyces mobaraensis NBRC 13819 = DSM 40847]